MRCAMVNQAHAVRPWYLDGCLFISLRLYSSVHTIHQFQTSRKLLDRLIEKPIWAHCARCSIYICSKAGEASVLFIHAYLRLNTVYRGICRGMIYIQLHRQTATQHIFIISREFHIQTIHEGQHEYSKSK